MFNKQKQNNIFRILRRDNMGLNHLFLLFESHKLLQKSVHVLDKNTIFSSQKSFDSYTLKSFSLLL